MGTVESREVVRPRGTLDDRAVETAGPLGRSENIREASQAMQAMAHPLRLKILCLVGNQELSVLEIVEAVGTTQSNVSQHLGMLKHHGLLESRKEANKVFYRIGDPRVLNKPILVGELLSHPRVPRKWCG